MSRTKYAYETMIWIYKDRLQKLPKIKDKQSVPYVTNRRKRMKIKAKIDIWRHQIKRIEKREQIIKEADKKAEGFFGFSMRNLVKEVGNNPKETEKHIAKNIFCKYMLENNIAGNFVADYLGYQDKAMPARNRLQFTRSFKDKPENKELFNRFKNYSLSDVNIY